MERLVKSFGFQLAGFGLCYIAAAVLARQLVPDPLLLTTLEGQLRVFIIGPLEIRVPLWLTAQLALGFALLHLRTYWRTAGGVLSGLAVLGAIILWPYSTYRLTTDAGQVWQGYADRRQYREPLESMATLLWRLERLRQYESGATRYLSQQALPPDPNNMGRPAKAFEMPADATYQLLAPYKNRFVRMVQRSAESDDDTLITSGVLFRWESSFAAEAHLSGVPANIFNLIENAPGNWLEYYLKETDRRGITHTAIICASDSLLHQFGIERIPYPASRFHYRDIGREIADSLRLLSQHTSTMRVDHHPDRKELWFTLGSTDVGQALPEEWGFFQVNARSEMPDTRIPVEVICQADNRRLEFRKAWGRWYRFRLYYPGSN